MAKGSDKKGTLKKYQQLLDAEKKRQQRAFESKARPSKVASKDNNKSPLKIS